MPCSENKKISYWFEPVKDNVTPSDIATAVDNENSLVLSPSGFKAATVTSLAFKKALPVILSPTCIVLATTVSITTFTPLVTAPLTVSVVGIAAGNDMLPE